eukprot:2814444-Rhodomonas_salina.1
MACHSATVPAVPGEAGSFQSKTSFCSMGQLSCPCRCAGSGAAGAGPAWREARTSCSARRR